MIEADGLTRSFADRVAVEALRFHVPEGKLCVLLGPNGAGKTTTVRMLLGLLRPSAGSARVAGYSLPGTEAAETALRARAGLLTETPGFYDRMSGRENLDLFGSLYGLSGSELRDRVDRWLKRMEIWDVRDTPFATWSKGMKQRLALIRAVLHEPKVLFLDEPTSGLDPAMARGVRDLIAELRGEGVTILLCTHNLAEAAELADLIGILRRRMVAFGTPAALSGAGRPRLEITLAGAISSGTTSTEPPRRISGAFTDETPTRAHSTDATSADATSTRADTTGAVSELAEKIRNLPGVPRVEARGSALHLEVEDLCRDTPTVVRAVVSAGGQVLAVRPYTPSLEEIYLRTLQESTE